MKVKMDTVKLNAIAVEVLSKFKRNMLKEILQTLLLWVSYSGFEIIVSLLKARNKLIAKKKIMYSKVLVW